MSAIPHLSNAYHSRNLRTAIENELKQEHPPAGGTLTTLAEAVKSVRVPIGIELNDKLISENIESKPNKAFV